MPTSIVAALFDRTVSTFGVLPALLVISLLLGIVLAVVFGWISPQTRVRAVKNKIAATILEAILYRHDTGVSLAAQGRLLGHATWYLLLALPPILVLLIPTIFFMGHLNELFGYRLPTHGERMLVEVSASSMPNVELQASGSLAATPTLHIPAENKLMWRLDRTSLEQAKFTIGASSFDLSGPRLFPVISSSWWERLLYPATAAPALPPTVDVITLGFPQRTYHIIGHDFSWLTIFIVISLTSGYITARMRGISI